jgi:hypothetical protein
MMNHQLARTLSKVVRVLPVACAALLFPLITGCDNSIPVVMPTEQSGKNVAAVTGTPPSIGGYNVYYGHIHNHCSVSDGSGTPDQAYNYAKNTAKLDFFGLADHSGSISSTEWTSIKDAANAYNQDGVFAGFWGFEWSSNDLYGHVAIINTDDYCATASPTNTFTGLMTWLSTRNGAAFCNHPGREDGSNLELSHFTTTPSTKVVGMELWNKSDPFSDYYYNDGYCTYDSTKSYFDEANSRGWKLGASGSEDNHSPTWGTSNDYRMAILSTTLTRTALFDAINARCFFSTLDKNIALSFTINGQQMGSTISGGSYTAQILATDGDGETFTEVKMFDKNHTTVNTWTISTTSVSITWPLTTVTGDYYYVKVKQSDGNEAISSPIWISGDSENQAPTVSIVAPVNESSFQQDTTVTVSANASDVDGSVTQVEFFANGVSVGIDDSAPYSIFWTIGLGSYSLTAKATDNLSAQTTSTPVTVTGTSGSTVTLSYDDFETSFGMWTDGGSDCSRYTSTTNAHQGNAAIDMQDNSSTASAFWLTTSVNVTSYTQLTVDFWFMAVGMESGEDFWLQYFNGTSWVTIGSWVSGTGFSNNTFYSKSVSINSSSYTFPTNASFRFMCDASSDNDDVYIDEIRISGSN